MKKILVGICGIGNGHLNRQICVINELKSKGFEVLAVTSKDKISVIKKSCSIEVLPIVIPWIVCNENGVNFKATLEKYYLSTQDRFKNFLEFSIAVEKYFNGKPDLVITDYEPNVAEYAYASNLKLITMEQQSKFLYLENIKINDFSIDEEINRINYFFPKYDMKIISSFFPIDIKENSVVVVPPIIERLEKRDSEENKVLVYFSPYSFSIKYFEILNVIKKFKNFEFIVYTKENINNFNKYLNYKNIKFSNFNNLFKNDLLSASFLITTSGHQLLSEAISIDLPVITIPLDTYEQNYNALMIEKYKLGMKSKDFTYEVLKEFLENRFYFINNIKDFKNKYYKNNWQETVVEKVNSVINE